MWHGATESPFPPLNLSSVFFQTNHQIAGNDAQILPSFGFFRDSCRRLIMKWQSVTDVPNFKLLFNEIIFNPHEIYSSHMNKSGMFSALPWWCGRSHRLSCCSRGLWWMSLLLVFNEHSSAPSFTGESSYRRKGFRGREKIYEEVQRKRKQRRWRGNRKCGKGRTRRSHIVQKFT